MQIDNYMQMMGLSITWKILALWSFGNFLCAIAMKLCIKEKKY